MSEPIEHTDKKPPTDAERRSSRFNWGADDFVVDPPAKKDDE